MAVRVLQWAERLVQVLVPPAPRRVAWTSTPDYAGNAYHLFRHVVSTRTDLEHVWLVRDRQVGGRIREDLQRFGGPARGHRVQVLPRHSLAGYRAYVRSRWVFSTHGVYRTTRSAVRRDIVSLYHGMPLKRVGWLHSARPDPVPAFGTLHLATSHVFQHVIAAAFRAPIDDVLVTGLPRNDVLVAPHPHAPSREALRRAIGLEQDRRLVVWMPTWRVSPSSIAGGAPRRSFLDDLPAGTLEDLDRAAGRHDCTVVVKLHPYDVRNDDPVPLGCDNVRLLPSPEWLATGIELYDMLAVADGLLSDVSSVMIDWLATDRPLGLVGFDASTYTRGVTLPLSLVANSGRAHHLVDAVAMDAFFRAVAEATVGTDDLSPWLYEPRHGDGCETVLVAVDL